MTVAGLPTLLEAARAAEPARRIELRDRIAEHGAPAVVALTPWLADPVLAAFAVRVIERVGLAGERELAAKVLRAARKRAPEEVLGDVEWALRLLRPASRSSRTETTAPAARPSSPARRSTAHMSKPTVRRPR